MSATDATSAATLAHYLQNADHANIGDAGGLRGSVAAGSLYLSLHTADPSAGDQTTSEATYTGYVSREAVARALASWNMATADPATAKNANAVPFDPCTGGNNSITHVGIGTDSSGVGTLLYVVTLDAPLAVSNGITPEFAADTLTVTAT